MQDDADFSDLIGVTLRDIQVVREADTIRFVADDGRIWTMEHCQDCCESVVIEDIAGDVSDLVGSVIIAAEESTNDTDRTLGRCSDSVSTYVGSFLWTFYTLRTMKGTVTIRWLGESNGYYSERVDFKLIDGGDRSRREGARCGEVTA